MIIRSLFLALEGVRPRNAKKQDLTPFAPFANGTERADLPYLHSFRPTSAPQRLTTALSPSRVGQTRCPPKQIRLQITIQGIYRRISLTEEMVEAAGIEPASKEQEPKEPTCVVGVLSLGIKDTHRPVSSHPNLLNFAPPYRCPARLSH
jgi:hypothetical protein